MNQNLVDINLTTDALTAVDNALTALEASLTNLIALTPDQRQQLVKMGDKSEAFCRQAGHVFAENPGILPGAFDLPGYQRDLAALDALRPRLLRLSKLYQRAQDTDMALGSDLMANALQGYAFLKVAGKGQGLDEMRRMLSARFSRSRAGASEPTPAAEPATA